MKVLFVCLGNICRSPTAEGVFRHKLRAVGLEGQVQVDSAGTGDWHVGKAPDSRTRQAAQRRGYDLSAQRARQVEVADFQRFDLILAMDQSNLRNLQALRPAGARADLDLYLRRFDLALDEVPDPYYGGEDGFEQVLDLIEQASDALLIEIKGASVTLNLQSDMSLKPFNSFGVDVRARLFAEAHDDAEVREALSLAEQRGLPLLVVGGGSNLLLTGDVEALVLRMASRGLRVLDDAGEQVLVEAEAGEPWHPFVQWSLAQGFSGLENLSLIPGTVGAAPMQNIGAYGVEVKDLFAGLTALDRHSGELREFALEECAFAYRDSLFKREAGRWLILRVRFRLARQAALRLDYGPVRQRLVEMGVEAPTASDVSRAICAIRSEKLPDPAELGNAGSFFKNPVVSFELAERIRAQHADLVSYPAGDGLVKLAAGWLIERAGWKGFRDGDAAVHRLQALVLVNHGHATGAQLLALAQRIQGDVLARFGVDLEIEPNVL